MNRFVRQCDEIFLCVFYKCGFLMRGSGTLHWPPLLRFEKWNKQLCGISLASFDHQRKPKRSFFARAFGDQKSVQNKEKRVVHVFRNWQAAREKKSYPFTPAGECVQSVQSLEERLEDLHSLSLKFCLTKFFRTIERAFVQVSHSFVNWFPNTRVWIS